MTRQMPGHAPSSPGAMPAPRFPGSRLHRRSSTESATSSATFPRPSSNLQHCGTTVPDMPPPLAETIYLRIAWSQDAFHLHVHVVDPNVVVNPMSSLLWNADAVEVFIAGTGTLHGAYTGSNEGGAIQIVLSPPADGFPTRGTAFFNPMPGVQTNANINQSIYAGRLTDDGYGARAAAPVGFLCRPGDSGRSHRLRYRRGRRAKPGRGRARDAMHVEPTWGWRPSISRRARGVRLRDGIAGRALLR